MIGKLLLTLVLSAAGLFTYLYIYLGASKSVEILIEEQPPLTLLFLDHTGAYHYIGTKIGEVETWASKNNVACPRTFGEYLDSPEAVDQDRLRSRGGCIVQKPLTRAPAEGMRLEDRPGRRYLVARFEGSPSIGPFKVYPKVYAFIESKRLKSDGPVLEIYTVNGDAVLTEYLFPIASDNSL